MLFQFVFISDKAFGLDTGIEIMLKSSSVLDDLPMPAHIISVADPSLRVLDDFRHYLKVPPHQGCGKDAAQAFKDTLSD